MVLTDYFIKKETKALIIKSPEREHCYRSMAAIRTALFICDAKDWNEARSCIDKLKALKKTVNTAIFAPTEKDVPTWYSNYVLLRADKDVTLWGFPEKYLQKQFNSIPADVIMDFTGEKSAAMYYLMLQHPSTFKVGIKQSPTSCYDLSIVPLDETYTLTYMFDQITGYLQTITSN
ncbi:MAG: hypothetical protein LBR18_05075 [Tannerella sp.]|jgi:hypothetical protein|nr:hypothetical protein [Tannerella sp.]